VPMLEGDEHSSCRCRSVTCLCVGTALMDFTSHIGSQATPAYALALMGGDVEAVATLISYCTATGGVVEFLLNPWLGRLSDRYGRMVPLLLCPALNAVARGTPPMVGVSSATLMFGRGVAGGARAGYFTAVKAAIADIVPAQERTAVLGRLGAFQQGSFMVGMFSAGVVCHHFGPRLCYIISSSVSVVALTLMAFGMRETLTSPKQFTPPNPFSFFELLSSSSIYNRRTGGAARKLALVLGLQKGTGEPGLTDAKNLYNRAAVGWNDAQRGNFLAIEGMCMLIANAMTGRVVHLLGATTNLYLGCACKVAQYITMGLTSSARLICATLPLAIMFEASQSVDAALTTVADETQCGQGRLSSDVQNLQAAMKAVFPIVYGRLFRWGNPRGVPGLAYFVYCFAWLLSMGIYATVPSKYRGDAQQRKKRLSA
jgi:DHA1 family tetracycline resistance protein-like MFS transporter